MSANSTEISLIQGEAQAEIACYSLPYGGIGFASHIITYYTMIILLYGRRPLQPWKKLEHKKWGFALSIVQLIATTVLSAISIHRCQQEWPFVILGVWMLTTSIAISVLTMSAPFAVRIGQRLITAADAINTAPNPAPQFHSKSATSDVNNVEVLIETIYHQKLLRQWAIIKLIRVFIFGLWFCGCVAGIVAVYVICWAKLYQMNITQYMIITSIFGFCCFLPLYFFVLQYTPYALLWMFCFTERLPWMTALKWTPLFISMFVLLWMDWTLGLVIGNLVGTPTEEATILYWSYFVAKRIGLLSA